MATNESSGVFKLETKSKTYRFKFTYNAICAFEEHSNKTIMDVFNQMSKGAVSFTDLRTLLWVSLLEFHEDMTVKDAGSIIDEIGITPAIEKLSEAISKRFNIEDSKAGDGEAAEKKSKEKKD